MDFEFEEALRNVENLVSKNTGKTLSELQRAIIRVSWYDEKYENINSDQLYYSYRHIKDEASKLWKLLAESGIQVRKKTFRKVFSQSEITKTHKSKTTIDTESKVSQQDWGKAPDVAVFFGRSEELKTLEQWIIYDCCRLVALIGIGGVGKTKLSIKLGKGGIGKTDLSLKLAQGIKNEFDYVIWRSLFSAPQFETLLKDLIDFFSNQKKNNAMGYAEQELSSLLHYLREHRCLLILDNIETILQGGNQPGQYREGYEDYGQLFRLVGESAHQSCLLLTSREKPSNLVRLAGRNKPVRFFELSGLDYSDGQKIFAEIGDFFGSEADWQQLIKFYNGNPLALELAAHHIQNAFFGNISEFINRGKQIFKDLEDLLEWHFSRLSELEKEVIYWLAINRQPLSLLELKEDLLSSIAKEILPSTIQLIQRHLPLEKSSTEFTLQPVLIEYITEKFIRQICKEFSNGFFELGNSHTLVKAQAKDYIKEIQINLILKPILAHLITQFNNQTHLESRLKQIIKIRQTEAPLQPGYLVGNILNLMCHLKSDLSGLNLSNLIIWQADLQEVSLPYVNFSNSDLSKSIFNQVFSSIVKVAISRDGKLLAAGDANGDIHIWQLTDGRTVLTLKGHTNWVRGLKFSPDGNLLGSSSSDNTVRLWNFKTGRCLKTFTGHTSRVWDIAFSPDSQILASSSNDGTIRLWDLTTRKFIKTIEVLIGVRVLNFHPQNPQILLSGNEDGTVKLWNIKKGQCIKNLFTHQESVWSISLMDDGQTLITGGSDSTVKLWNINTSKCLGLFSDHTGGIGQVTLDPKGQILATASDDRTIRLWSVNNRKHLKTLTAHTGRVQSVAFSPDGQILVSGSNDQTVRIWDVKEGKCFKTWQGYTNWSLSLAFSPDGQILASGSNDRTLRLWNLKTGKCNKTLTGHISQVQSLAFSPDGQILASGSENGAIKLWNLTTYECFQTLFDESDAHTNVVWMLAFDQDSQILASGSGDGTVRIWDVKTGECLRIIHNPNGQVWSVAISPNGNTLANGSDDGTVNLWNSKSGKHLRSLKAHTSQVFQIAFSQDSQTLISCSNDSKVKLFDVNTGNCISSIQGFDDEVLGVAFLDEAQILVSDSSLSSNVVKVWNLNNSEYLKTLNGHTDGVWSVTFSLDGQTLASTSRDETIRLWDVKTGNCIKVLRIEKIYEQMNISNIKGLTKAQKDTLRNLGAIEN